ncbi:spore germination protein [Limnochorda pilosa]|uniref:Spore gernimation protein GerA n=1 Tax=Limnochorda pilosa TaxID=1555112 RepID=A0A0K2SIL3_LIMPI|nr:spore gernimation protein GerA [Limnochorda pilosa]
MTGIEELQELPLGFSLDENLGGLRALFRRASDWVLRRFRLAGGREAAVVYIDGMVEMAWIDDHLVKPLMYDAFPMRTGGVTESVQALVNHHALAVSQVKEARTLGEVANAVLDGDTALLVDGEATALVASHRGWKQRGISESTAEAVIRGPREAFVEVLRTNTSMLRRRLKTPCLKLEALTLGTYTRTDVVIAYLDRIAPDAMVQEVRSRVQRIQIDGVLESEYLEELIRDEPFSLFPVVRSTERPDVVAAELLEGRVAILTANTPYALIVPAPFWSFFQAPEDYYHNPFVSGALRLLRLAFMFLALMLPSLYVAVTTFHADMLPTSLLITLAAAREGVPFPAFLEALMMEVMFEVLREAGLRLPQQVGQAVSIVGALVIGQAAVSAGIVSAPMVILVAITGIASFTTPTYEMALAIRFLRFPVLVLGGMLGLYGLGLAVLAILVHLADLRSFGVPYLFPLAPLQPGALADVLVRRPQWSDLFRPRMTAGSNVQRAAQGMRPAPPTDPAALTDPPLPSKPSTDAGAGSQEREPQEQGRGGSG